MPSLSWLLKWNLKNTCNTVLKKQPGLLQVKDRKSDKVYWTRFCNLLTKLLYARGWELLQLQVYSQVYKCIAFYLYTVTDTDKFQNIPKKRSSTLKCFQRVSMTVSFIKINFLIIRIPSTRNTAKYLTARFWFIYCKNKIKKNFIL